MKTDRELLELAAKANGYQVKGWINDRLVFFNPITQSAEEHWNPLTDDGDALRLAVRLRLEILFFDGFGEVAVEHNDGDYPQVCEPYGVDIQLATRRAIVRAAAAIGESLS